MKPVLSHPWPLFGLLLLSAVSHALEVQESQGSRHEKDLGYEYADTLTPLNTSADIALPPLGNNADVEPLQGLLPALSDTGGVEPFGDVPVLALEPEAEQVEKPSSFAFIERWLGVEPVSAWQKSRLAEQSMKPGGLAPAFHKFGLKVYASKEATRGGTGIGGGGCGCN